MTDLRQATTLALDALTYIYTDTTADEDELIDQAITAIKEALAQPEQEPVAYLCENGVGHRYFRWKKPSDIYKPIGLYTTPPQRPWVGLTDEDWGWVANRKGTSLDTFDQGAAWAQQRLQERNK